MPAFLTHWRILIETARRTQDAGSDIGSLIIDASVLRRRSHGWSIPPQTTAAAAVWDTGPLPEVSFPFPGSDISSMAFLGALAPDIMYYRHAWRSPAHADSEPRLPLQSGQPVPWSDLFHHSHSGDVLTAFLEQVALVPSPALRSQALAFALGYASHIATDIALNPWIDSLVADVPERAQSKAHIELEHTLDKYLADNYFEQPRYSIVHQQWERYIAPAARELARQGTPVSQMLHLLSIATEVYQLEERQIEALTADFLEGLRGLRVFLSGGGRARWLALTDLANRSRAPYSDLLAAVRSDLSIPSLDAVLEYTEQLSERLCRLAVSYYTVLRNPSEGAAARASRRAALVADLRSWDLVTGFDCADPSLHNWSHFSDLWPRQNGEVAAYIEHRASGD